jgi:hypothetical protein
MTSSMRRAMVAVLSTSLLAGLAACSNQSLGVPTPQGPSSSTQSLSSSTTKPALQVTPSSLTFASTGASAAQTFVASVQFAGNITAVSSDPTVATVSPGTATPTEPANGTGYSATFTVTPIKAGTTTITVTDKKGDQTGVAVTVAIPNGIITFSPVSPFTFGTGYLIQDVTVSEGFYSGAFTITGCLPSGVCFLLDSPFGNIAFCSNGSSGNENRFTATMETDSAALSPNNIRIGSNPVGTSSALTCTLTLSDTLGNSANYVVNVPAQ